ncbi:LOW QUALITY PROTEIN: hypothetical protein N665_0567s0016 [Sinapis alba]|nr:LOW QUALITY PROTEIN: hypothetical protein N665_0567s0016 [Sinapis alba]
MRVPKKRKILAVGGNRTQSWFQGDAEMETVYSECDEATRRPSLVCNGVVCIPEPNWVSVMNPSTGEYLRFCSGPFHYENDMSTQEWWSGFNINTAMGFGKDEVNGKYKVVSMLFDHNHYQILDVDIGQWRKLVPPPPYKEVCVCERIHLLALDLHTKEFRDVHVLPPPAAAQIVNLDHRLAIADICVPGWNLEIWIMDDAQEETWTMTYCISFTPLAVSSKEGSLFFYDSKKKRLFKYDPETDFLCFLSSDICVISSFLENLVRLQPACVPKTRPPWCRRHSCLNQVPGSRISNIVRRMIPNIILTSTLVSLICFGYSYRYRT